MTTDEDFSLRAEDIVGRMSEVMAAGILLLAIVSLGYLAPWSPLTGLAAQQEGVTAPHESNLFNPDATLDTSRMRDRS